MICENYYIVSFFFLPSLRDAARWQKARLLTLAIFWGITEKLFVLFLLV
jgi:hypothetical protein